MIDAYMNPATFPWDQAADQRIRQLQLVDPERRLGAPNAEYLIELGTVYGREGDDWQNPNVWQGRGILAYPNEQTPGLDPHYGVDAADNYAGIVLNIRATQHLAIAP